jgi:lipopolysaccharide heptosyltransferase I
MPLDGSPRILITRLSHIGDCVLTMPLACALRRALPRAYIAWAVEKPSDQLLAHHPALDQVWTIPRGWLRRRRAIVKLAKELKEERFDLVFDPQSLTKSAALGWLARAPKRIGMARPNGRELAPWLNNVALPTHCDHLVDRTLELMKGVGVEDRHAEFRFPIPPDALQYIASHRTKTRPAPLVALNPGGTWRSKQWELDRYAEVARFARDKLQLDVWVTWAGADERRMADQIADLSCGAAEAAPPTDLRQLTALLAHSVMFVGGDTGPMHIAAAVGTPCVALFGPTRPCDSGPYGAQHETLQAWYQSGSCRARRTANNDAMRDIRVEDVCAAVERVVRRQVSRKPIVA